MPSIVARDAVVPVGRSRPCGLLGVALHVVAAAGLIVHADRTAPQTVAAPPRIALMRASLAPAVVEPAIAATEAPAPAAAAALAPGAPAAARVEPDPAAVADATVPLRIDPPPLDVEAAAPLDADVLDRIDVQRATPPPVVVGTFDRAPAPAALGVEIAAPVVAAGFDRRPAPARTVVPLATRERPDSLVEILFKPIPEYTDEARGLHIEGTVVLDVEFTASNQVRIRGVVSGLGHGLDESAGRAAAGIRFNPARRGGIAVDVRTTVQIVFRVT